MGVDPNAILTAPIATQLLQTMSGEVRYIGKTGRRVQAIEGSLGLPAKGLELPDPFAAREPRRLTITVAQNHRATLTRMTSYVNRNSPYSGREP